MKTFSKDSVLKELPEKIICHMENLHSWLEIPYLLLVKLDIQRKISEFSYRNGDIAYLEWDFDAQVFIYAYRKFFGIDSSIENYKFYWKERVFRTNQEISFVRRLYPYYCD